MWKGLHEWKVHETGDVSVKNGILKEKGLDLGAELPKYKTLHASQGELMSRFLKHSTWNILFNIYDVPIQTGPLRCKF